MLHRLTAQSLAAVPLALCLALVAVRPAVAQRASGPLSAPERNCVITSNKIGVKIFSAQGKLGESCIKRAGKAALETTVEGCMQEATGTKVEKLTDKVVAAQDRKCKLPLPPYGYADAETISDAAVVAERKIDQAAFGSPIGAAIVLRDDDFDGAKCQLRVVRSMSRYATARLKEFKKCKKNGLKDGSIVDPLAMESCITADPRQNVSVARERIVSDIETRCGEVQLGALFPGECASSGASAAELGTCISRIVDCKTCTLANDMDGLLYDCDTLDDGAINGSCRTCGNGIVESPEICDDGGQTSQCDIDCTLPMCGDGVHNADTGEECDDGNGIDGDGCDLGCILSGCGNGVLGGEDEQCDDGNDVDGDGCDASCQCEPGAFISGCHDTQCPRAAELIQMAATGRVCSTDADCPAGICDEAIGRCRTPTTDDLGSSGIVHNVDSNEASVTRLRLTCPGPGPVCGQCIVDGIDPLPGNCRCANNNHKICDAPLRPDADDCGGAICQCYEGPPSPNSAGNTPVCTVWKHASDVSGTLDVDTGEGVVFKDFRAVVHLGEHLVDPCPRCLGDVTADDGIPHGTCQYGPNSGEPCDVNATHTSFPAPGGGGGYSLDCMPSPAKNISAEGVHISMGLTTGTSVLPAAVPCGLISSPELCPCGVCSGDPSLACSSNSDCAGVGTCGRYQDGVPAPNDCIDGICSDVGGEEGKCFANEIRYCDGVLRADGRPFVTCQGNADCDTSNCGGESCGACTLVDPLDCFLDDVVTVGQADPLRPVRGASYCLPPSTAGVNAVLGIPGVGRMLRQEVARYLCTNDGTAYVPGQGGCP